MKNPVYAGVPGDGGWDNRPTVLALFAGLSLLLHLVLVGLIVGVPRWFPRKPVISPGSVVTVNMVSLPGPSGPAVPAPESAPASDPSVPLVTAADADVALAPETTAPAAVPLAEEFPAEPSPEAAEPEPAPPPPPTQERVVMENAPPPASEPTTEPEPSPQPAVKRPDPRAKKPNAVAQTAVTPEAARADAIQEAIRRVQQKVAEAPVAPEPAPSAPTRSGQGRRGRVVGGVSDVYKAQIRYKVEQNWAFSDSPARKGPLRAVVVARIGPDGGIRDVWFEKRSGNTLLDDSAYRAVMKANPLPPLPPGLSDYTIAMVFTPSGIQ